MTFYNDRNSTSSNFISLLPVHYSSVYDLVEITGINCVECVYILPDKIYATLTPCNSSKYFLLNDTLIDQETGVSRKLVGGCELVHLRITKIPDSGYPRFKSKSPPAAATQTIKLDNYWKD